MFGVKLQNKFLKVQLSWTRKTALCLPPVERISSHFLTVENNKFLFANM